MVDCVLCSSLLTWDNQLQVLALSTGLKSLCLDDNSIKATGAESISKALEVNSQLHTLQLSCNRYALLPLRTPVRAMHADQRWGDDRIDDMGCRRLAHALRVNQTVHTLFLDRNNAADDFGQEMGSTIKVSHP